LLGIADNDEFERRYVERLDRFGIEHFRSRFQQISEYKAGAGLVLLCFEKPGEFCHRRLFARWIEQQTGQHIPELPDDRLSLFE
jgi:hypothetical protein